MKRILSAVLVLILILSFAGCKQDKDRNLYNLNLEKYVELGDYKNITVDTTTKEFEETKKTVIAYDVQENLLYKGTVKKGDVVNIDYRGEKDGVAFEGGTAQGYNLEIGSGTFIPGFEEGLIGATVGSVVPLELTFPKDYDNEELAGAEVVFTVRVNYTDEKIAQEPKEYFKKLGYKTIEEYEENVKQRAIEESLINQTLEVSKVKKYPQADIDSLYDYYYSTIKSNVENAYGMTMDDYFEAVGQTEEKFKETTVENEIKPLMEQQMVWYAILDKEGMSVTKDDIEDKIKEIIAQNGDTSITRADVIERYGEIYLENVVVSEKVFDFLEKNAKVS